jgi:phosphate starvation-inducible PhoH-like protein
LSRKNKARVGTEREPSCPVVLSARNEAQKEVIRAIKDYPVVIISGPAGTGKTHIPVIYALQQLLRGNISRIVFTRPCVEAYGENLGYLPGDFNEKIAPYMMPVFDILCRAIDRKQVQMLIDGNAIQTIPLAFQRGITFNDCFVIADEFQNTIPQQFRMFLTRMGENCKMVITGDPSQNDISGRNGLVDAIERFKDVDQFKIIEMNEKDIVRNPLIEVVERKYGERLPSEG